MMVSVAVIPAKLEHIPHIAKHMRIADVAELAAASGIAPAAALDRSLKSSDFAMTATVDGVPMCMFGVGTVDLLSRIGVPWLLGTDDVELHYRRFARGSRFWLGMIRKRYSRLVNAVDARNTLSIRWLRWLGFTLHDPVVMGSAKLPFHPFELRCSDV